MLKKFFIGFFLLLVASLLISLSYSSSTFEEEYATRMTLRQRDIFLNLKKLEISNICDMQTSTPACFSNYIKTEIGIHSSLDLLPIMPYSFIVCKKDLACVCETLDKIIALIRIENLDLLTKGDRQSSVFQTLLNSEKKIFKKILLDSRKIILEQSNQEEKEEQKNKLLIYIKNIDQKMKELEIPPLGSDHF